jgi:GTPase SAR1 family protein
MFSNRATGEANVRVVLYGPAFVGKSTLLRRIHGDAPESQRGRLLTATVDADSTLFFELARPEFGEVGSQRIRLHLYTLAGQVHYANSGKLILRNVDAVVFVADAQRERQGANRQWYDELLENLAEQGLQLAAMPHVLCVTKCEFANAESPEVVASVLGSREALRINPRTGEGLPALMGSLLTQIRSALAEGRLKE